MNIRRPDQFQGRHVANSSFLPSADDMWLSEPSPIVLLFFLFFLISSGACLPRGGRGGGRSGGRGRGWFSSSPRRSSYGSYSSSSSSRIARSTRPPDTILFPTGRDRSLIIQTDAQKWSSKRASYSYNQRNMSGPTLSLHLQFPLKDSDVKRSFPRFYFG